MIQAYVPDKVGLTAADIVERFGPIPIWRIRRDPPPGEATEEDVVEIHESEKRCCELVDGILVEKTVGAYESHLAVLLASLLTNYVRANRLGAIFGTDGMMRLAPELIRIPDISFARLDRLPDGKVPRAAFIQGGPDLAAEVISPSNTKREMDQKLVDYFNAGVQLVWYVYPQSRQALVYTSASDCFVLDEKDTLDGGDVLPVFELKLADLFAEPV